MRKKMTRGVLAGLLAVALSFPGALFAQSNQNSNVPQTNPGSPNVPKTIPARPDVPKTNPNPRRVEPQHTTPLPPVRGTQKAKKITPKKHPKKKSTKKKTSKKLSPSGY